MRNSLRINQLLFGKNWGFFLVWGLAMMALGLVCASAATFTTMFSVVLIGIFLLIAGVVVLVDTFSFWWRKWPGFFMHLIMGSLYAAAGYMLISDPLSGSISLTFLLGVVYLVLGSFRTIYSLSVQTPRWGWSLFNGLITLTLGFLILASWPNSSLFIIGLFVGIDLFFCGVAYTMAALAAKSLSR